MLRRMLLTCVTALTAVSAVPAHAQDPDATALPQFYIGIQGMYARPVGEFHDYVEHGGGLNASFTWPVQRGGPFALRADGAALANISVLANDTDADSDPLTVMML